MAKPTGSHSATKKGGNGTVSPKAPGQTTATKGRQENAKYAPSGNNSRVAKVV